MLPEIGYIIALDVKGVFYSKISRMSNLWKILKEKIAKKNFQ